MHENSRRIFLTYVRPLFGPGARVLEIGPDGTPSTYRTLAADPTLRWETLDLAADTSVVPAGDLDHLATSEVEFPLPSDAFDLVFSGQVIEHVRRPWRWLTECARVTRPGGRVITICPVSWPYHEAPVDCWRMYPEALRALYEEAGLEVELAVTASLDPVPSLRRHRWFLVKQAAKALIGAEPFLAPLAYEIRPVVDSVAIGRKPPLPRAGRGA